MKQSLKFVIVRAVFPVVLFGLAPALSVAAEKSGIKIKDVPTEEDTSIIIKKGAVPDQCVDYEILSGTEEVVGGSEYDRSKAYASWKTACNEWKQSMREMNKENHLLTLNCNSPKAAKEEERFTFQSAASYRVKVRMREKK